VGNCLLAQPAVIGQDDCMPHLSLTHSEATARATAVSDLSYELEVDLSGDEKFFRSVTTVRFGIEPGSSTFLEVRPHDLVEVRVNGARVQAEISEGRLALTELAAANEVVVTADFAYSHSSEGMHRFADPADGAVYVYAQPSITDAPCFMAAFDQPDLKAPVKLTVIADKGWLVRANGSGRQTEPGRWEFEPTKPIATYLITLVAGPFAEVRDAHDGIELSVLSRKSYAQILERDAAEILTATKACFDRFHELFGIRYPFGKYDQAFVPEFSWGAMEFPGLIVFRDEYLFRAAATDTERLERAAVIAHEMAHMWFGDLVTMRWWDDLWLNESFATYMGYRVTSEVTMWPQAWTRFGANRKIWGYAADQRPSTHPVAPQEVADTDAAYANFDGISYAKGCSALRQLVALIGDEAFFSGLRAYFHKHAWGNATLADLLSALAESSGRDIQGWAKLWLRTPQVNTLRPLVTREADGTISSVVIEQSASADYPVLRPHRIGVGWLDEHGQWQRTEAEVTGASTPVPALAGVKAQGLLLNDGDLTFAKVRLDDQTRAGLAELIKAHPDSLSRTLMWASAWDSTRDAEWPATEFLALLEAALPAETDVTIIESVMQLARAVAVPQFLPPSGYEAGLAQVSRTAKVIVDGSVAGSTRQLAGLRALIGTTSEVPWLRGLLDGEAVPEGIKIDADLRWAALTRLAVLGEVSEAEIDAELAQDNSARGAESAVRCRASRPDPAAKDAAFDILIREQGLSNRMVEAAGAGFWRPEHAELTGSYVERFFTGLPRSEGRSGDMLATVAGAGYPAVVVTPDTVNLADQALAGELHPLLRRALVDATDDLRRALLAQRAGAGGKEAES
jgi:aminopeptidase N